MFTRKEFLIVIIATFITIVVWITFNILHRVSQVKVSDKVQEVIEPINPNFDLEGLK